MRIRLAWLALSVMCSPASANMIQATFTGTVIAGRVLAPTAQFPAQYDFTMFSGNPFTANYLFDTSRGTLLPGELDGGLVRATITIDGWGTFGGDNRDFVDRSFSEPSSFTWNSDFTKVTAKAGGGYQSIFMTQSASNSFFQFGVCASQLAPPFYGPCGSVDIASTVVSPLPVPSSIAGVGVPGLLLVAILIGLHLRRAYGAT